MKHYELLTILPGTMVADEVATILKEVVSTIEAQGAKDVIVHDKGKSKLAYPIKHIRYGYFHIAQFTCEPENIPKIETKLALITDLLRNVITTFDPEIRKHDAQYRKEDQSANLTTLTEIQKRDKRKDNRPVKSTSKKTTDVEEETKEDTSSDETQETTKTKKVENKKTDKKVKLDEIDKKLDEILDTDLKKV